MSIRVLVVDDTVVFRRIISDALAALPGVEVVGTASNGKAALARLGSLNPDLITLDIEMPEMNGMEVLEALSAAHSKVGVVVLSALTVRGSQSTIRALELGAFDFITKPDGGSQAENLALLTTRLLPILRAFERRRETRLAIQNRSAKPPLPAPAPAPVQAPVPSRPTIHRNLPAAKSPFILIGVSTGGPSALAEVLPAFPENVSAPIFVVQHMPPMFTHALAERLQTKSSIRVKEAEHGEIAMAGCAYIAPGGRQMKLAPGQQGEITIQITDDPPENNCRPSVDYLFRSVALHFPGRSVAAILTGMGNDGTRGLKMLKRGGCCTIAQDEASCVVFGMPREAIAAGVIDIVAPLNRVAETLTRCLAEVSA